MPTKAAKGSIGYLLFAMTRPYKVPALGLLFVGAFLYLVSMALPVVFSPWTPDGIFTAAHVIRVASAPIFMVGGCLYARGIGYPFWFGLFSITLVGMVILMWLPDRNTEPQNGDA